MKLALTACAALLLTASCGPDPRVMEEDEPTLVEPAVQPPPDPRRYIGRWAASEEVCPTEWWRFWADEVLIKETQSKCEILPPDASFSDTDIRTVCPGKRENWALSYDDSGDIMTVSRPEQEDVVLRRCS